MKTKTTIPLLGIVLMIPLLVVLFGCATLDPNANALAVRAEQLETVATPALDSIVNLDNSNRDFFKTNAPAFHAFAEWLRTPIIIEQTNALPRGLAMIKLVDDAKLVYEANVNQSNILLSAMSDLQAVVTQAQSWNNVLSTTNH